MSSERVVRVKRLACGWIAGLLFGTGLAVSGMTDPRVVTGFLDLAGAWNPALALVMAGALAVTTLGYRVVFRLGRPLCRSGFALPTTNAVDAPLMGGAALFGIGWGVSGYCPGPAIAALSGGWVEMAVFVVAMALGLGGVRMLRARTSRDTISRDKGSGV